MKDLALRWISFPFIAMLSLLGCTGVPKGAVVVDDFELESYLGTWYEIARFDHSFERGLDNVRARYELREDGGIDVVNRGYKRDEGRWKEARGKAYFHGKSHVGRLKVSFFGPFYSSYNIIALDEHYQYAMIAGPSHKYFWILAREPQLPKETLQQLQEQAILMGFNMDQLIMVRHDDDLPKQE
ncbi:lipocalin family protein [Desulfurispira natronophila]|uniref:Outer membrane lipoprotein Blc n=1 Tax=Desulfurispira natronophila TaxID=682562 RepID=A0A7W8DFX0_9BACT|nr:lipocalin family protein [Desulfurispira natronophila]MBB5020789.1 apolipoprotein D and lipocalin family protein [Desulfurispira natronophila]